MNSSFLMIPLTSKIIDPMYLINHWLSAMVLQLLPCDEFGSLERFRFIFINLKVPDFFIYTFS